MTIPTNYHLANSCTAVSLMGAIASDHFQAILQAVSMTISIIAGCLAVVTYVRGFLRETKKD